MSKLNVEIQIEAIKEHIDISPKETLEEIKNLLKKILLKKYELELKIMEYTIESQRGNDDKILAGTESIIKFANANKMSDIRLKALVLLADIKQNQDLNKDAIEIIDKILEILKKTPNQKIFFDVSNTKLVALHRLGQFRQAIKLGEDSLNKLHNIPKNQIMIAKINNNLASSYEFLGDLKLAESHYFKTYSICKNINYQRAKLRAIF
ncbi:MAG: hypothetical protein ACTSVU_09650 [Promethearchaeota archaeon]